MRLIDADALAKRVHDDIPPVTDKANYLAFWHLIDAIDEAPTIEAEPVKHGHWIAQKIQGHRKGTVRRICSNCGANNGNRKSNYCPSCGAKMDLEG